MPYCEKCRTIVDDSCPVHKQTHLREPEPNDPVLIAELSGITAAMLEGVLLDEKLPFLKEGRLGAGMSVWIGSMMEIYSFYVPYALREQAQGLYALVCETPAQTGGEDEEEAPLPDEDSEN